MEQAFGLDPVWCAGHQEPWYRDNKLVDERSQRVNSRKYLRTWWPSPMLHFRSELADWWRILLGLVWYNRRGVQILSCCRARGVDTELLWI